MSEIQTTALPFEALIFGRTATATRVHQAETDGYPLCQWSRDQLEGLGRIHPDTLEDATRVHGTPAAAVRLIMEQLKFVTYDEIWLPYSKSYVALGLDGRAVAGFGKTYVWVGRSRIDLPGCAAGRHTGRSNQPTYGETCPTCSMTMPLTGICDDCNREK